ncbi:MAG: ASKHA domain-containing protein [Pseudomonadota bacterium]
MADAAEPAATVAADAATARVLFMPSGRRGVFPIGTPVLEAARSLGVYVESVCGGRGICGRCQVTPAFGQFAKHGLTSSDENLSAFSETERRYADRRSLPSDRRLSCSATVQGDLVIDVPTDTAINGSVVRKRAEARRITPDPAIRLFTVAVAEPRMDEPLGDYDRLIEALDQQHQIRGVVLDPTVLPSLQAKLRQGRFTVTVGIHQDGLQPTTLIAVWPGQRDELHGIAVDIGSTTIACHLVELTTGRTIASVGTANPQIRFGEDLMSRVSYAMLNTDGQSAMTAAVRTALISLVDRAVGQAGLCRDDVLEAVFVGNPIMHHLFLGIDPTELGGAPFALATSSALHLSARDLALELHPGARVYMLPCIAGHVGADAAAVALAEGPSDPDERVLVVDVGTNAEIVLGTSERVLAASSPTGPAFEGAEISSGQRAAPGAIERVRIDPQTLEPRIKVIGCDAWSDEDGFAEGTETFGVTGICGSAIIEVVAELFLTGIVTHDGVLDPEMTTRTDRVVPDGRTASYVLWRGAQEIRVTQTDVRAIQLAKAALFAGCKLLMDKMEIDHVDRIKLAGAFGAFIDPKYAMILGLIPDCALTKVAAVGNAAGTGARMALLNRAHRREVEALVRRIEKVETAIEPRFQEHFVNAMALPNKAEPFPRLQDVIMLPAYRAAKEAKAATSGRRRRRRAT